ncbi:MAG: ribosome-associated translation inhibitor RaiA [Eubacteriales bacterium]|nr:ribosome-associated translation inhibitor RaiA [Eubacteriales bacterium]
MKYIITARNFDVTEGLKERIYKKMGKLEKFFNQDTEAAVTLNIQKNRHRVEVTIPFNGVIIRAEEENGDMYSSIDKVVDVVERQIRRNRTRLEKRLREGAFRSEETMAGQNIEEEKEFNIIKIKRFEIKPMPVEEAILQMNLVGHEFYVFINSGNSRTNVVYRRKNGGYGLIEPEA